MTRRLVLRDLRGLPPMVFEGEHDESMGKKSQPGDPGQAGKVDPKKGGKFRPAPVSDPAPASPHAGHGHGTDESDTTPPRKPRPQPH